MNSLSNKSKAASGLGFLGMATVVTMHKAAAIAERAHHKPDKEAHEVKLASCVRACKTFVHPRARQIESREAMPNDLYLVRSGHLNCKGISCSNPATSVLTERKSVCREQ